MPISLTQTRTKYGAIKVTLDGYRFDSKAEARRYSELRLLERGKYISELTVHPVVPLVIDGVHICDYVGDFLYLDQHGRMVLEDVKSPATRTPLYRLKRKLVEVLHHQAIVEVTY
jgi:Protein of unknown function (DUF1064)